MSLTIENPVRPETFHSNVSFDRSDGSLPIFLTRAIGRRGEIATLTDMLRLGESRIVTLTGPGGAGKTRLSVIVADKVQNEFTGGTWFVPLGAITTPDYVPTAIATAIGVKETGTRTAIDSLVEHLTEKRSLIILDNFEQVLGASPSLAALAQRCPQVTLLVTSRERLRIAGETVFRVPPMTLPDANSASTVEELRGCEAIELFEDRAKSVDPSFALCEDTVQQVTEICERLDGLPLAIELAAARIVSLPLSEIVSMLDRQLTLLTGGPRDQPERLQTMRKTISWSHTLLPSEEKLVFRRLALFEAGATVEMASDIAHCDDETAMVEVLSALVEKNLLRSGQIDGRTVFWMPRPIREFAFDSLRSSGEESEIRERHVDWCIKLVHSAHDRDYILAPTEWTESVKSWQPEIRAAIGHLRDTRNCDKLIRTVCVMSWYWLVAGQYREAIDTLDAALEIGAQMGADANDLARGYVARGYFELLIGKDGRAERSIRQALDCPDNDNLIPFAMTVLASIKQNRGQYKEALPDLERAVESFRCENMHLWGVLALINLGGVRHKLGQYDRAESDLREATVSARKLKDFWTWSRSHLFLATLSLDRDRPEEAADQLARAGKALECAPASAQMWADWFARVASLAAYTGQNRDAARLFGAAERDRVKSGIEFSALENEYHQRYSAMAHQALGAQDYGIEFDIGMRLERNHALELGRQIHDSDLSVQTLKDVPTPFGLTARELEILCQVSRGLTNREIAADLYISDRTVSTHVRNLLAKLDVRTRTEASSVAHENGIC